MKRRIICESTHKTVYEGMRKGELFHYFTDAFRCMMRGSVASVPGKGVLCQQMSAFLFSRLSFLGVVNHFIRTVSMRESLVHKVASLPFDVVVRCGAVGAFAECFHFSEGDRLDYPIVDYYRSGSPLLLSESQMVAAGWIELEDVEEIHEFVLGVVQFLQGMLIAVGLNLMEIRLVLARTNHIEEDTFILCGEISPETLIVEDIETKAKWGGAYILSGEFLPEVHYQQIAGRFEFKKPSLDHSCVLLFAPKGSSPSDGDEGLLVSDDGEEES